jgi:hypothetical protein
LRARIDRKAVGAHRVERPQLWQRGCCTLFRYRPQLRLMHRRCVRVVSTCARVAACVSINLALQKDEFEGLYLLKR